MANRWSEKRSAVPILCRSSRMKKNLFSGMLAICHIAKGMSHPVLDGDDGEHSGMAMTLPKTGASEKRSEPPDAQRQ